MRKVLTALAAALVFASCAPSSPQARIQQSPQKFEELSETHRKLVEQGQIARGMSPDAVYLAWGAPSRSFQGSRDGNATERWDYSGSQPVFLTNFHGAHGFRPGFYGPYGRFGHSGFGFGLGPDVAYIPYRIASVWFVNHSVDAWERAR